MTTLPSIPTSVPDQTVRDPHRDPRTRRFWAVGLVAVFGLFVAGTWTIIGLLSAINAADDFARADVPGTLMVQVTDTGTQYVYYEGDYDTDVPSFDQLDLQATGPSGARVTVDEYGFAMEYDAHGGLLGTAVASFEAVTPGAYSISATTAEPGARLAVGPSVTGRLTMPLIGAGVVLVLSLGAALALAVRASRTKVDLS